MENDPLDHQRTLRRLVDAHNKRMFFIVGLTRPGTTWLQHAIDAHSDVCCRGEGHFTDSLLPLMGRSFADYNQNIQKLHQSMTSANIANSHLGRSAGFSNTDVSFLMSTAVTFALVRQCDDEGVLAIGEKTPEHAMKMDDLSAVLPESLFVHVIRDGRDEAVSVYDYNVRAGNEAFIDTYSNIDAFVEKFARNWVRTVGEARKFGRKNPDRYLEIRSEDLLTDPTIDVARLCRFLQVDDADDIVAHCTTAGRKAAVADGAIGQWRDRFNDLAATNFARSGGELLRLLEYGD